MPGWMKGLWHNFSSQLQSSYFIVPLSQMELGYWILAVAGLGVYVGAFVAFQQWRTEGKWLSEMKDRLHHPPE